MNWLRKLFGGGDVSGTTSGDGAFGGEIYVGDDVTNLLKADMHNNRGADAFESDDFDKAIKEYRKAVELFPKDLYYMNLGNALVSKGAAQQNASLVREGISALESSLQLNPGLTRAQDNLSLGRELLTRL